MIFVILQAKTNQLLGLRSQTLFLVGFAF